MLDRLGGNRQRVKLDEFLKTVRYVKFLIVRREDEDMPEVGPIPALLAEPTGLLVDPFEGNAGHGRPLLNSGRPTRRATAQGNRRVRVGLHRLITPVFPARDDTRDEGA